MTSIDDMFDDYDWQEAFKYADWTFDDVAEVLASDDGQNDGDSWICVVRLKDGRFGFLSAGCDYTGWDCQAGGSSDVRGDLDALIWNDLGEEDRVRLGYPKTREASR